MKYFSLNHNSQDVSFLDAVRKGLAPDRGLYFPNEIPKLPEVFYNNIKNFSNVPLTHIFLFLQYHLLLGIKESSKIITSITF